MVLQGRKALILGFIIWPGSSGRRYRYAVYPPHWRFDPGQSGNYIYTVESKALQLSPLWIGQTEDLDRRLREHESEFNLFHATHLCVHFNYYEYGAFGRLAEEKDLIERWRPARSRSTQKLPIVGRVGMSGKNQPRQIDANVQ